MPRSRTTTLLLAAALGIGLGGCSSDPTVSASGVRDLAVDAGDSPDSCPFDLDAAGALGEAGLDDADVTDGEVDVEVSRTTEPADDPVAAQVDDGATVLDALAGTYVSCAYTVGGDDLTVYVTASPAPRAAVSILAPLTQQAADLSADDLQALLDDVADSGSEVAPGGGAVLSDLDTEDDDGSAALLVTGDAVQGDDLRTVADELAHDVADS